MAYLPPIEIYRSEEISKNSQFEVIVTSLGDIWWLLTIFGGFAS